MCLHNFPFVNVTARKKPPLCKGRWAPLAALGGVDSLEYCDERGWPIKQSPRLRLSPEPAPFNKGATVLCGVAAFSFNKGPPYCAADAAQLPFHPRHAGSFVNNTHLQTIPKRV